MHYSLDFNKDIFELNPGLRAIEAYGVLTSQQMYFVCLVADTDYDNPVRTLPERKRREIAAKAAGYKMESDGKRFDKNARNLIDGKVESVEKGIATYRENQYDPDQANLQAVDKQIQEVRDFLMSDKTKDSKDDPKLYADLIEKGLKLGQQLPKLVETKKELLGLINAKNPVKTNITTFTSVDLPQIEEESGSDEPMSTIDMVMEKQRKKRDDA